MFPYREIESGMKLAICYNQMFRASKIYCSLIQLIPNFFAILEEERKTHPSNGMAVNAKKLYRTTKTTNFTDFFCRRT